MTTPGLKRWLVRGAIIGAGLLLVGFCFRDFWFGQMRTYLLGMVEVRAEESGHLLPEVDEIEVIALDAYAVTATADTALGHPVSRRSTLRGADAVKVAGLWRYLRRGRGFSAMCHNPVYVLRFRQRGRLLLETSVCWRCHNYTLPVGIFGRTQYGFDSEREDARSLFELLQSFVPLPKKPGS